MIACMPKGELLQGVAPPLPTRAGTPEISSEIERETRREHRSALLLVLLGLAVLTAGSGLRPLSLGSAGSATAVGRGERVVDVPAARQHTPKRTQEPRKSLLLRVESDDKRRNVDNLLADADVPLPDEDSGVVDRLGESVRSVTCKCPDKGITDPSLNTWVWSRRSKKSSVLRAST